MAADDRAMATAAIDGSGSGEAPTNFLFLLSDEHRHDALGSAGHPFVHTPHLDTLTARGTRFTDAYCNSPICVPSRASLATGRYPHDIGVWDNATPYTGRPEGWHHALRAAGHDMVSIGKLHFRGGDDYGFTEELLPLHVVGGQGDLKGLLRRDPPRKGGLDAMAKDAGRGRSEYSDYDARIAARACDWLRARRADDKTPFALFVSFVMPHFPLVAPDHCYERYERLDLAALSAGLDAPAPDHPVLRAMRSVFAYDDHFDEERRAVALRAYFGMVTRLDELIGTVLAALDETGRTASTRVLYTSDHGDNLGNRGWWGKSNLYEDSVAVPMIAAGPGIPEGQVCRTPVSLVDVAPSAHEALGVALDPAYRGRSLWVIARAPDEPERPVFAEYHAAGAPTGLFMLRRGRWKYVAYAGADPQLFDLEADPSERHDLAGSTGHAAVLSAMAEALAEVCDVDAVDARAFADQADVIARVGGRAAILESAEIPHTPAPA